MQTTFGQRKTRAEWASQGSKWGSIGRAAWHGRYGSRLRRATRATGMMRGAERRPPSCAIAARGLLARPFPALAVALVGCGVSGAASAHSARPHAVRYRADSRQRARPDRDQPWPGGLLNRADGGTGLRRRRCRRPGPGEWRRRTGLGQRLDLPRVRHAPGPSHRPDIEMHQGRLGDPGRPAFAVLTGGSVRTRTATSSRRAPRSSRYR